MDVLALAATPLSLCIPFCECCRGGAYGEERELQGHTGEYWKKVSSGLAQKSPPRSSPSQLSAPTGTGIQALRPVLHPNTPIIMQLCIISTLLLFSSGFSLLGKLFLMQAQGTLLTFNSSLISTSTIRTAEQQVLPGEIKTRLQPRNISLVQICSR